MKTLTLLAILALSTPAFADHRHYSGGGHSNHYHGGSHYYGGSGVRISYGSPYYSGYRSYPYYRSYGYGYGGYNCYPYRSGYYLPGITLGYSSYSPAYYSGYTRSYYASPRNSSSIEVDVQRELRRRGYYRGGIDGDIGPESRSAIRAWQDDRGLSVTGRIDGALLRSLGI